MSLALSSDASVREFLGRLASQARQQEREQQTTARVFAGTEEAFRWAQVNSRTKGFQPRATSGNSAIYESEDLMGRRVRNQQGNVSQVKRVIEAFQDLIVGTGMQTFADPFHAGVTLDELIEGNFEDELDHALEADDLYDDWFLDKRRFSTSRKLAGPEFQRLALKECVTAGSVLILECLKKNRQTGEAELCYQLIEREQLDKSMDRPAAAGQNKIVNGIEFNEDDEEIAFHIFDAHPYDDFSPYQSGGKSRPIPAERVNHLVLFNRPSDTIGVTWLHAIAQNQFDRDRFIGSEIATAAKAALLLLVHKFKNLAMGAQGLGIDDGGDTEDEYGNPEIKLSGSPHAFVIGQDDDVELLESNRPISTAESFMGILDRDTAAGVSLSPYTITGNWEKTNFSSGHGAQLNEDAHIRPLQNWFARELAIPIRRRKQQLDILSRKLKTVPVRAYLSDPRRYERFEAIGAGRYMLDPVGQTEASLAKLRSGLSTLKLECAREGLHWIRVLRQKALENRVSAKLQVVLDFSKGQGAVTTQTTSDGTEKLADQRRQPTPKKERKAG